MHLKIEKEEMLVTGNVFDAIENTTKKSTFLSLV